MKAKDLIGQLTTRIAPSKNGDSSFMGSPMLILNADDEFISYIEISGIYKDLGMRHLSAYWCDDNWKPIDYFQSVAEKNLEKYNKQNETEDLELVAEVRNTLPALLDEIERLTNENKMYENILRDLSPCNQFSIGLCDICDNDRCGMNFLVKKWRRKDKS